MKKNPENPGGISWGSSGVNTAHSARPGYDNLDLDSLKHWCRDKMPRYWTPTRLKILPEMPRNVMGKVNKKELVKTLFVTNDKERSIKHHIMNTISYYQILYISSCCLVIRVS